MITTHVLDTASGRPAAGVPVLLEARQKDGAWKKIGSGETDTDGRLKTLASENAKLAAGVYRLIFHTEAYFKASRIRAFFPAVEITFEIDGQSRYHVPLLLSPFGYSTYRGS